VPPHQFGEGGLGIVPGKFPHQVHVVRVWHLMNYPRRTSKVDKYFLRATRTDRQITNLVVQFAVASVYSRQTHTDA
jgi:hypothetical protein